METLEAPPITEEDIALFLDTLNDEPLKCEAPHDHNGNTCSLTVTHRERITCAGINRNACANEAKDAVMWGKFGAPCGHCGRKLSDCWIINPI